MTDSGVRGLLLLDKPTGITSHTAVRRAARLLGGARTGHAGTLDPLASGLLLVGLGNATRLLEFLVGLDKTYRAVIRLGEMRDTLDREGKILETRPVEGVTPGRVAETLGAFRGEIEQLPPLHSAIKDRGVPLHRRVRRGEEVTVSPRRVRIDRIDLLGLDGPELSVEVACSSGTYIRSLARDIGERLGTGACLWELRRTACGPFSVEDAVTLEQLDAEGPRAASRLLPAERMAEGLPRRVLDDARKNAASHGMKIADDGPEGEETALFGEDGALVALAVRRQGFLCPRKVFA
jgi:tRNA pseudouridine55 synthase